MFYENNQPDYITSCKPDYVGVSYDVIASGQCTITDYDDMCEPDEQTLLIKVIHVVGPADRRDISRVLDRALTPRRCHCEHDCCGHRHGHADIRWLALDRVEAVVTTSRNY